MSSKHFTSVSDLATHMRRYEEVIKQLMSAFHGRATCDTSIAIHRLLDANESDVKRPISCSSYSLRRSDSANLSRTTIFSRFSRSAKINMVDYIQKWIEDLSYPDDARALLVVGDSCSASSVAHEIATQYSNMARLVSSFTFNVSDGRGMHRPPQMLVATLARDLADFDAHFASGLRASIASEPDVAISADCSLLFEHLVQKPAAQLSVAGPVVIVIDGLDFNGTPAERMELPKVLAAQLRLLPANFRFVLTMKTDHDIESVLAPAVQILRF